MSARPTSAEEVAEAVRAHSQVAPCGGGTKERLVGEGERLEIGALAGITEYEASEYTFTAKAGTTVKEVMETLETKGQYLPFDPYFAQAGATLGGTVASGISGAGRFRYGGLRDFLIGVQFVDGAGRLVRSGGKVVKNAAGFDLPKFLVGSLGRFGILTEVCFKVFPAPFETATLRVECGSAATAVERMAEAAKARWEVDALEFEADGHVLMLRLGAPERALDALSAEVEARWPGEVRELSGAEAATYWREAQEMNWANDSALVKVADSPSRIEALEERLGEVEGASRRYSSGGAAGWIAVQNGQVGEVDGILCDEKIPGLLIRGEGSGSPLLGFHGGGEIVEAVKKALDPAGRFPAL